MLDEKIQNYKKDIAIARNLAKNEFADQVFYNRIAAKLEKILGFYERLKILGRDIEV
jgi:hypothetical protein